MKYTQNYKMKLPEQTDKINIDDLNSNFSVIDREIEKLADKTASIQLSDVLEVTYASGSQSFYHGTMIPFTSLLQSVGTTWGSAEFRNRYGDLSVSSGSIVYLSITLEVENGVIYWDEYYNGYEGGEISLGSATFTQTSTGDTVCSFDYENSSAEEPKTYELRDAILELAQQIQALRKGE